MITKLASLSISKIGLEMVETQEIDVTMQVDVLLLDDECYQQDEFEQYKQANSETKAILLYAKSTQRAEGFDAYIQKPFLPTELVKTLSEVCGIETLDEAKIEENTKEEIKEVKQDEELLDLGDLDLEADLETNSSDELNANVLDERDIEEVKQLFADADSKNEDFEEIIDLNQKEEVLNKDIGQELEIVENQQEQDGIELPQDDLEKSFEDLELDRAQNEDLEELEKSDKIENTETFETAELPQEANFDALLENLQKSDDESKEIADNAVNNQVNWEVEGELETQPLENNEIPQVDIGLESQESQESAPADISEYLEVEDLKETEDLGEFDSLSLEAMSEALGEPSVKEPNIASIVPKEEAKEVALPSNVQINSLDSLIGALQTLQTQSLKELLSGATINISIQFPKKED